MVNDFLRSTVNIPVLIYFSMPVISAIYSHIFEGILKKTGININGDFTIQVVAYMEFLTVLTYFAIIFLETVSEKNGTIEIKIKRVLVSFDKHKHFLKKMLIPVSVIGFLSSTMSITALLFPQFKNFISSVMLNLNEGVYSILIIIAIYVTYFAINYFVVTVFKLVVENWKDYSIWYKSLWAVLSRIKNLFEK